MVPPPPILKQLWHMHEMGEGSPLFPWSHPQCGNLCHECGSSIQRHIFSKVMALNRSQLLHLVLTRETAAVCSTQEKTLVVRCTVLICCTWRAINRKVYFCLLDTLQSIFFTLLKLSLLCIPVTHTHIKHSVSLPARGQPCID